MAALGMAVGAGWMGARAMTSTSGPGISLMAEFAGLAFFAEVPVVIWDVQRMGPSTGLPTRTSQGDLMFVRFLGHGDTKHVILLPGYADRVLRVRLAGLRHRRAAADAGLRPERPRHRDEPVDDRSLRLSRPADGPRQGPDGRRPRPPGIVRPLRRCRRRRHSATGPCRAPTIRWRPTWRAVSGHDEQAHYTERPEDWSANMVRLWRKTETARQYVPEPVIDRMRRAPRSA